jgi:hypothetical protein
MRYFVAGINKLAAMPLTKKMKNNKFILIICIWTIIILFNYYIAEYFIRQLVFLVLILYLFIMTIYQFIETFRERKSLTNTRIQKVILFTILFFFTLTSELTTNRIIEHLDWIVFYNCRNEIIEKVIENKLNPNIENTILCQLPFDFPIISNNDNRIRINRTSKNQVTVEFFIKNNFFDIPTPRFVYTNDTLEKQGIFRLMKNDKRENWKISDNWYRISD